MSSSVRNSRELYK